MNLVGCGEAAFPAAARTDRPELAKVTVSSMLATYWS
jgi:hypothetical protein